MSAFVVGHDHIDALLTWAIAKRVSYYLASTRQSITINTENAEEVGRILLQENERSVGTRYDTQDPDNMPGTNGENDANYRFRLWPNNLTPVSILKACRCFDYQACETEDYERSVAYLIVNAIRHHAVSALPDWDAAPGWEFRRTEAERTGPQPILLSSLVVRRKRA